MTRPKFNIGKVYAIDGGCLNAIHDLGLRLATERNFDSDEMRDLAQVILEYAIQAQVQDPDGHDVTEIIQAYFK